LLPFTFDDDDEMTRRIDFTYGVATLPCHATFIFEMLPVEHTPLPA